MNAYDAGRKFLTEYFTAQGWGKWTRHGATQDKDVEVLVNSHYVGGWRTFLADKNIAYVSFYLSETITS